ncbi:uncharacterized protein LOC141589880 [Silene latifolia]|uniref:uncharacterized protein LOC141589880 n=1 Tax=Silene latifolia TaxID=37657 RepID=UPI003D76AB0B
MKIATWNIRGGNDPLKQKEILDLIKDYKLDILGVLETRIRKNKAAKIITNKFHAYNVICNYSAHTNGRIWLIWRPDIVTITPLIIHAQFIHCVVSHHATCQNFHLTMVYASNNARVRDDLWENLLNLNSTANSWIVLGDFNVVRDALERVSNTPPCLADILDFNSCLLKCGLDDINSTECDMTWTNNQDIETLVWSKLDRALANTQWMAQFPTSAALFLPSSVSDHSPGIVTVFEDKHVGPRFSFLNCWVDHPNYHDYVQKAWQTPFHGSKFFTLFSKLKHVRTQMKVLHKQSFTQIQQRVRDNKEALLECQRQIQANLHMPSLYAQEKLLMDTYIKLKIAEGSSTTTQPIDIHYIQQGSCVPAEDFDFLTKPITDVEIKAAVFSISADKSPGPHGFSSAFFKASWDLVGPEFCTAVHAYFKNGRLSKQANATLIALIPKKKVSSTVMDFRPISYCTTFYKAISKVLSFRLQAILPKIIGPEQAPSLRGATSTKTS